MPLEAQDLNELKKKVEEPKEKAPKIILNPSLRICEICEISEEIVEWEDKECTKKANLDYTDPSLNCKCFNCVETKNLNPYCSKPGDPKSTIHWICRNCFIESERKDLSKYFKLWNLDAEIPKSMQEDIQAKLQKDKLLKFLQL